MPDESQKPVSILRRPNVVPLAMAAFFNDMGSDMLFAFYPLFVINIVGASASQLGLIQSLALTAGFLIRPFMGKLADKQGRKKFIAIGYVCLFFSRMIQGLANVWWHLVPPKLLYELGRGVRNPPRSALITDSVPKEQRGLAFGIQEGMDTFGAVLGPLLGMWLFYEFTKWKWSLPTSFRLIFFASAVPTIVSFFIIIMGVRNIYSPRTVETEDGKGAASSAKRFPLLRNRTLFIFTLISCVFSLWAVNEDFMVVRGFKVLSIESRQAWEAVLLYWFINITFAPMAFLAGKWSDKHGRKIMVTLSFLLLGALTLGFGFVTTYAGFAILFLLHGIHRGLLVPCQTALVADLAPADRRAEVLGSYQMWTGYCVIPAPYVFGKLVDLLGWKCPFIISGVLVLLCAAALIGFLPADQKASEGSTHGR